MHFEPIEKAAFFGHRSKHLDLHLKLFFNLIETLSFIQRPSIAISLGFILELSAGNESCKVNCERDLFPSFKSGRITSTFIEKCKQTKEPVKMPFPLMKLFVLGLKQASKHVANAAKSRAKTNERLRLMIVRTAQCKHSEFC